MWHSLLRFKKRIWQWDRLLVELLPDAAFVAARKHRACDALEEEAEVKVGDERGDRFVAELEEWSLVVLRDSDGKGRHQVREVRFVALGQAGNAQDIAMLPPRTVDRSPPSLERGHGATVGSAILGMLEQLPILQLPRDRAVVSVQLGPGECLMAAGKPSGFEI